MTAERTTTWGDCPDPECLFYGRLKYGIEPGDTCEERNGDRGCYEQLRWWDRWHDGKHRGDAIAECEAQRRPDAPQSTGTRAQEAAID